MEEKDLATKDNNLVAATVVDPKGGVDDGAGG